MSQSTTNSVTIPSNKTLIQAFKLSLQIGKPVETYFYLDSCKDSIYICANETDKIIYKSIDEHTSPVTNIYKSEGEYLIVTENSIYILSAKTKVAKMPKDIEL
jgi:hypothetical protein